MKPFEKNKSEGRMRKAALAAVLLGLMLPALTATATQDTYQNDSVVDVMIPPSFLPVIDATNFINNNSFAITFTAPAPGGNPEPFESHNTINYTNNGVMVVSSSFLTNVYGLILTISPGSGFMFDRYKTGSGLQTMAGSFYNPGEIRVNSLIDTLALVAIGGTIGKCTVLASNIVSPGVIQMGANSLMQITGRDVDLTRGSFVLEGFSTSSPSVAPVSVLQGLVGGMTNLIFPPVNFSLPNPFSPLLFLTNATGYFEGGLPIGPNATLTRAVFIANSVPSVTNHVYFDTFLGGGGIFVEWSGPYHNPVTADLNTNYFYLFDNFGEITNLELVGFPAKNAPFNYTWISGGPLALGPPALSTTFLPFTNSLITNKFSYESVQFIATTQATNASTVNPNGALTNLTGRIQITASRSLDLTQAQISGLNYMLLSCTNQFNGAAGAQIFSPFADIALGVTNGFMSVSNVLEPSVPNWVGPCQVFSARWNVLTTNFFGTITNVYHVLLVNSSAANTAPPQVQNLWLHATNLVISDALNTFGTVSIDAQSLTLTTNMDTPDAPDGELNIQNPTTVWGTALPNLRNLTNNGAIRILNANPVNFGSAAAPYNAFINHGIVFDQGATVFAANFESTGMFSNNVLGSFILQSQNTTLTNGSLHAGGDVSITTGSLLTSNLFMRANRSLTLTVTNQLTDTGPTNGSIWIVGTNANTGGGGIQLLRRPASGDLLGTTITNYVPAGKNVINVWAATNYGVSTLGYTNNAAIGRLILNAIPGSSPVFTFKGVGASNAIYVDYLELRNAATNRDQGGDGTNFVALNFNTNLVIYYAQAVMTGVSVAKKIDRWNSGHLRWVPQYIGQFSSTNVVVTLTSVFGGVTNVYTITNTVNVALAQSGATDTNGVFYDLPVPFTTKTMAMSAPTYLTNSPPYSNAFALSWITYPLMTNMVEYSTDMVSWRSLTNFVRYPTNQLARLDLTNFISIFPYQIGSSGAQSVTVLETNVVVPPAPAFYYRVYLTPIVTY